MNVFQETILMNFLIALSCLQTVWEQIQMVNVPNVWEDSRLEPAENVHNSHEDVQPLMETDSVFFVLQDGF